MTFTSPNTVTARSSVTERVAWRPRTFWIAFFAILLVLAKGACAQDNATITGTVTDTSGAVVPNAEISLTNPATGQIRKAVSNNVGSYRFANVGVGTYSLSTSVTGFQSYSLTGIVVNVAQTLEENISLKVGGQGQTVTVVADSLQVQTETSAVTTLMSGEQVSQLATNGRNITSLAALGLGVSNNLPPFGGVNALTSANGISFNGTRPTHNIYMLDGGEQNDRGCGGCFMNLPSQDALAAVPDAGQQLQSRLWNRLRWNHSDGAEIRHQQVPRRTLLVQPQHGLQRQRLLHQGGGTGAIHLPIERTRRKHRWPVVHSARLQRVADADIFLLE